MQKMKFVVLIMIVTLLSATAYRALNPLPPNYQTPHFLLPGEQGWDLFSVLVVLGWAYGLGWLSFNMIRHQREKKM